MPMPIKRSVPTLLNNYAFLYCVLYFNIDLLFILYIDISGAPTLYHFSQNSKPPSRIKD